MRKRVEPAQAFDGADQSRSADCSKSATVATKRERQFVPEKVVGVRYRFAPDWKEEHVLGHLADARGIFQADGYKGYAKLYAPEPDGTSRLREAACWAHLRRDFHDFWTSTKIRDRSRGA